MRVLLVALFMVLAAHVGAQEPDPTLKGQPIPAEGQGEGAPAGEQQPAPKEDGTAKLLTAIQGIEAAIRDLIAATNKGQSEGEKDREMRDLEAQESMALWAKAMFWATVATVFVAGVGIAYVRKTLFETRRIGKAETRAYLSVSGVGYEAVHGYITINLQLKNNGNSPARNITIAYVIEAIVWKPTAGNIPQSETLTTISKQINVRDVQAGSERAVRIDMDQDTHPAQTGWDRIRDHVDNGRPFRLGVVVSWMDVFKYFDEASWQFVGRKTRSEFDDDSGLTFTEGILTEDGRTT